MNGFDPAISDGNGVPVDIDGTAAPLGAGVQDAAPFEAPVADEKSQTVSQALWLSVQEQQSLLALARRALIAAVTHTELAEPTQEFPRLLERRACFVTLTRNGALRGCVGQLLPQGPLYQTVVQNVRGAAFRDPRFPGIEAEELKELKIEISVLTEPQTLRCGCAEELLNSIHPGADGVVLRAGQLVATFLPQVWQQIPDKVKFLEHLSQKAGCAPTAWRNQDTELSVYQVESCAES